MTMPSGKYYPWNFAICTAKPGYIKVLAMLSQPFTLFSACTLVLSFYEIISLKSSAPLTTEEFSETMNLMPNTDTLLLRVGGVER